MEGSGEHDWFVRKDIAACLYVSSKEYIFCVFTSFDSDSLKFRNTTK
jgi:hypothetical protein